MIQHVSKEIAIRLKEVGFDMPVIAYYVKDSREKLFYDSCLENSNKYSTLISAPTYDEVIHWLRDSKGMHIQVFPTEKGKIINYFGYVIHLKFRHDIQEYKEYHEAQLEGILMALIILENQTKEK